MSKLIGYAAAGALLLAAGMQIPANAQHRGGVAASAARGAFSAPMSRGSPGVGAAQVFRGNPGVATAPGAGMPRYRGNAYAYQGRDNDGRRFHHRRFIGPGVFAYGAAPYYYDYGYSDDSAYSSDDSECTYVWVTGDDGVQQRVYTCQ